MRKKPFYDTHADVITLPCELAGWQPDAAFGSLQ